MGLWGQGDWKRRKGCVHSVSHQTCHLTKIWMSKDVNRLAGPLLVGCYTTSGHCVAQLAPLLCICLTNALCSQASSWISLKECGFRGDANGVSLSCSTPWITFPLFSESWFCCMKHLGLFCSHPLFFWPWFFIILYYLSIRCEMATIFTGFK